MNKENTIIQDQNTSDNGETEVADKMSAADRRKLVNETVDLILNQDYNKDDAWIYVSSQKGLSNKDAEDIMNKVETKYRKMYMDEAIGDALSFLLCIVIGIVLCILYYLTEFEIINIAIVGIACCALRLLFQGIKNLYTSQTYGTNITFILTVIAVVAAISGVFCLVKCT